MVRRGRRLAYWTLFFTAIEAGVALFAGERADSTALIGFGVDSLIEVFSAGVVLWRLRVGERGERREEMALRLVGASLLLLASISPSRRFARWSLGLKSRRQAFSAS